MLNLSFKKNDKKLDTQLLINISKCCGAPETCLVGQNVAHTKLSLCATQKINQTDPYFRTAVVNTSICYNGIFGLALLDLQNLYHLLRCPAVLFFQFLIFLARIAMDCLREVITPCL